MHSHHTGTMNGPTPERDYAEAQTLTLQSESQADKAERFGTLGEDYTDEAKRLLNDAYEARIARDAVGALQYKLVNLIQFCRDDRHEVIADKQDALRGIAESVLHELTPRKQAAEEKHEAAKVASGQLVVKRFGRQQ